jgi:hypothetical protein
MKVAGFLQARKARVVSQFENCSGGLRPPYLSSQGIAALPDQIGAGAERRYSKLRHCQGAPRMVDKPLNYWAQIGADLETHRPP